MAEFTDYAENKILNLMRAAAWTEFAAYVGLFTVAPSDAGGGTEVSGGSYARELIGLTEATGAGGATSNAADITFTTATGAWGTISHVGIFDAISGGNLIMWTAVDAEKTVASGDTYKINAGDLDVTVA